MEKAGKDHVGGRLLYATDMEFRSVYVQFGAQNGKYLIPIPQMRGTVV